MEMAVRAKKTDASNKAKGNWKVKFKKNVLPRWQLYLFLLIPIIHVLIFAYWPMIGAQIAFRRYDLILGIWNSPWVGWDNFIRFFNMPLFGQILYNTVFLSVYGLIVGFPLPILLALMLNAFPFLKLKKTFQTVSYMPHFISIAVVVGMMMQLFSPRVGGIGNIYFMLTGELMPNLFGRADNFPHLFVWSTIWQGIGWSSIIYIAPLSSVDPELHEAAQIDGASRFKRVLHIDFPSIRPTVVIMLILACGAIMNVGFERAFLMQNPLNLSRSEVIATYVYKVGLVMGVGDFSFATAIGLFNSVINFTMLLIVNFIAGRFGESRLW